MEVLLLWNIFLHFHEGITFSVWNGVRVETLVHKPKIRQHYLCFQHNNFELLCFDALSWLLHMCFSQVRVNVGNGEGTLISSRNETYNDLLWHQVHLYRVGSRLELLINGKIVASGSVPKSNHDSVLDANLGVYLGGYGNKLSSKLHV